MRSRTARMMTTLMRNGRDHRSENPSGPTRYLSAGDCPGPISGSHQGQRPPWLHRELIGHRNGKQGTPMGFDLGLGCHAATPEWRRSKRVNQRRLSARQGLVSLCRTKRRSGPCIDREQDDDKRKYNEPDTWCGHSEPPAPGTETLMEIAFQRRRLPTNASRWSSAIRPIKTSRRWTIPRTTPG